MGPYGIRRQKIGLLIKFTQAKCNSYQLHIRKKLANVKWRPKPESWFFFEPGIITLGLKSGEDIRNYETVWFRFLVIAAVLSVIGMFVFMFIRQLNPRVR